MAKKRKSDATRLDEIDRTMYTTFCSAANSLSQLYTHAMNQQKLAFQAGERHSLEKLYQWILQQQEEGSRVAIADILAYLQNEVYCGEEESSMSPRLQSLHQYPQPTMNFLNSGAQVSDGSFGPATIGQGPRSGPTDHQAKNSVFSNALSNPIHRSLQNYHSSPEGYYPNNVLPTGHGARDNEANFPPHQNRDSNSHCPNDSSMDMHAESPSHY